MSDSAVVIDLRVAIRDNQDLGKLPCEAEAGRRFPVMVSEVAVVVLRELVNLLMNKTVVIACRSSASNKFD